LQRWSNAIATGRKTADDAINAQASQTRRAWSTRYGALTAQASWAIWTLPVADGQPVRIDCADTGLLNDAFREATANRLGVGWNRAREYATNQAYLWNEANNYAAGAAMRALDVVGRWYATEGARRLGVQAAENMAAATAAADREAERVAAARREYELETPERQRRMKKALERTFSDTRALARLQSKAPQLGADGVTTLMRAAALAAEAAAAEGADEEAQDAAAAAVVDEGLSLLDALYPLAPADYYVTTWNALTYEWQVLYLAAALAEDPAAATVQLAPIEYYLGSYYILPGPWQNLYQQLAQSA
jgi:hypothetical protein